jgi:murein DD-endopeptidase MepM/ murein hydrolase activator NlpD
LRKIIKFLIVVVLSLQMGSITYAAEMPVTSPFGWRSDPYTGVWKFHAGVDLGYEYGTGIPALFDGVVMSTGNFDDGYGNQVLLYHPAIDTYTRYAHCSVIYVVQGDNVAAGQIIAAVGSTGRSTGPHLHLEYIVDTPDGYQYTDPLILWQ